MPDILQNIWQRIARGTTLCAAMSAVLSLCACAPGSSDLESRHDGVQASTGLAGEPPMCRPDRALLVPARAPDCSFGHSNLKTLDPDQWARLKVEYERKCYQNAEKSVREKLRLLQAASRCEVTAARP